METKKDVSYLGKDFGQLRQNLIDFTKQYFPTTYSDFNEAAPGMIFLELASYPFSSLQTTRSGIFFIYFYFLY